MARMSDHIRNMYQPTGSSGPGHLVQHPPDLNYVKDLFITAGTATLVTGAVTVATGLGIVLAFSTTLEGTGAGATGVTEASSIRISSITTGAVACVSSYSSATAAVGVVSALGTSVFRWVALGIA